MATLLKRGNERIAAGDDDEIHAANSPYSEPRIIRALEVTRKVATQQLLHSGSQSEQLASGHRTSVVWKTARIDVGPRWAERINVVTIPIRTLNRLAIQGEQID